MQSTGAEYLEEHYYDSVGVDEVHIPTGLDPLQQSASSDQISVLQLRAQYAEELKQVEEEIQTLKQVLNAKYRRQHFLKRQLGITVINELREEVNKGIDNLRTSEAFQRTTAVVKTAKEKTSSVLHEKWNVLRQTNAFKSFEDKLGVAYSSVRGKLVRSATVSGDHSTGSATMNATTRVQPTSEVTWSTDTVADPGVNVPKNGIMTSEDTTLHATDATEIVGAPAAVGTIQLEQLALDERESDETEEFVQAPQPKASSKRRQKQKNKSFAD
ncbi:hypothetical protein CRM22_007060 [Opisthorchis felineus]|uniref:Uncharacterized protein n=1 Tax=Opisthorchis felineus TaxID=147828 RepID=A0A4S2LIC2_OPIFE|nr:hypothetical protein CRM22_007060 [Opisthorchis felineus]